jgi:hypothetical protein
VKQIAKNEYAAIAAAAPVITKEYLAGINSPFYSCARCYGDCMEPFIPDGSSLVFSRDERVEPSDVCAIYWAPGKNAPESFQMQVKQVLSPKEKDGTFVYRLFRPYTVRGGRLDDVLAIHRCIGFKLPDGKVREVDFAKMIAPFQFVRTS